MPKGKTSTLGLLPAEPAVPKYDAARPLTKPSPRGEAQVGPVAPPATAVSAPNSVAEVQFEFQPPRHVDLEQEEPLGPALKAGTDAVSLGGREEAEMSQPEGPPAWREEVAERVDRFRRRRAQLRTGGVSLDLDFDGTRAAAPDLNHELDGAEKGPDAGSASAVPAKLESLQLEDAATSAPTGDRSPRDLAREAPPNPPSSTPAWDMLEAKVAQVAAPEADARTPVREWVDAKGPTGAPVEIVLESDDAVPALGAETPAVGELRTAPLGPRFLAGLVDGGLLVAAGALFAGTLWAAGVHLSLHPVNLVVMGFTAALLFLVYFGSFTALTAATPGLSCVGIRVCNLEGMPPTGHESWWRAFGYLVSAAAMLLGFIWALLDSEGLTWHDRISGTLLVRADGK